MEGAATQEASHCLLTPGRSGAAVERVHAAHPGDPAGPDRATVYFGGAGREDVAAYHKMWTGLMKAGGGVELNEMSDLQVQVMPGGNVAIATCFIDNRTRSPDGKTATTRAFETDVWQKIDGKWMIISMHYSEISAEE